MTTAERLDKFMEYWDPYEYRNNEASLATTQRDLASCPEGIVNYLLDVIEGLEAAILERR